MSLPYTFFNIAVESKPGVYILHEKNGTILYIGKSKNIKRRLHIKTKETSFKFLKKYFNLTISKKKFHLQCFNHSSLSFTTVIKKDKLFQVPTNKNWDSIFKKPCFIHIIYDEKYDTLEKELLSGAIIDKNSLPILNASGSSHKTVYELPNNLWNLYHKKYRDLNKMLKEKK